MIPFRKGDRVELIEGFNDFKPGHAATVTRDFKPKEDKWLHVHWDGFSLPNALNGGYRPSRFRLVETAPVLVEDTRDYLEAVTK